MWQFELVNAVRLASFEIPIVQLVDLLDGWLLPPTHLTLLGRLYAGHFLCEDEMPLEHSIIAVCPYRLDYVIVYCSAEKPRSTDANSACNKITYLQY
jgi:hypothetical protein